MVMVDPAVDAAQPAPPKFSRYRSVRGRQDANSKDEDPVTPDRDKTNKRNPSIARSMSRYRRNRPSVNDGPASTAPPVPRLPDHREAQAKMVSPSPEIHNESPQEKLMRGQHGNNTVERLTGGNQASQLISLPLRPEPEKAVQSKNTVGRKLMHDAHSPGGERPDNLAVKATRKSFFQKFGLAKTKDPADQDELVPQYIGVGGGGIVPGIDAPVSAVNAGERRVIVQYSDTSVQLPVTPSTRVQDLLRSASQDISNDIDPEKFILIESFHQVGLERPLRRYEGVRDVMNSWSHDEDNRLIVIPPSSIDALAQLDAQQVPSERPAERTFHLYHSQRPGKWDKRFVTLRVDGQIVVSKKENSRSHANICHLSDFDIYSPSARALAKEIKPPKKLCFAIKSQQKSSMFLSTENFIHFFSTSDRAIADRWYRVVQTWRSWYLVNKMGAAEETDTDTALAKRQLQGQQGSNSGPRPSRSKGILSQKKGMREHASPPTSFPKTLAIDTSVAHGRLLKGMSPKEMEAATFSPAGLLGRTYAQRQQAMREREEREKRAKQNPFSAHSLLGGNPSYSPGCTSTSRSNTLTQAPDAPSRGLSVKQRQQPLVDLTPVFQESPQHARKGRGVTVEPGMPLIEAATGPDLAPGAVTIPPATAWRRPSVDAAPHRSNTVRNTRHAARTNSAGASPTVPSDPFMPNSLLASSTRVPGTGAVAKGHGVATRDRKATRPLLDMSPENPFAEGSLLRQL